MTTRECNKLQTEAGEMRRGGLPDMGSRATWPGVKASDLVFLDEFGSATNMARTRAPGPRGERVVAKAPHGHWKTVGTVAAMTAGGVLTAVAYDGPMNAEAFAGLVEQFLAPKLEAGQVLVLDNLSAHKAAPVGRLVEAAGARVMPLPPYSPDYNPIEMAISKAKSVLRKLAARSVDVLIDAIGEALSAISASDAANYIRHCGYSATAG